MSSKMLSHNVTFWWIWCMLVLVSGRVPVDLCRAYFCWCPLAEGNNSAVAHCERRSIRTIPEGSYIDDQIVELDLSYNRIVDITRFSFANMPAKNNLANLNLGNNELEIIDDDALAKFPNLKTLSLKRNDITKLTPGTFRGLPNLESLDLGYNDLKIVDANTLASTPQLATLSLRGNPLGFTAVKNVLSGVTNVLRKLDLYGLQLTALPVDEFWQASEIRHLILGANELNRVPTAALSALGQLEHLDLSDNPIRNIGAGDFRGLSNLRELFLNCLPELEQIEENSFAGMPNLTVVHASFNRKLKRIHARAFGPGPDPMNHQIQSVDKWLPALEEVSLRQNALTVLDAHLLPWQHIPHVDLYENPWNCDCNLAWIVNITWEHKRVPHISCKAPQSVRHHRVTELSFKDFKCESFVGGLEPRTVWLVSMLVPIHLFVLVIIVVWRTRFWGRLHACQQIQYRRMSRLSPDPASCTALNVLET